MSTSTKCIEERDAFQTWLTSSVALKTFLGCEDKTCASCSGLCLNVMFCLRLPGFVFWGEPVLTLSEYLCILLSQHFVLSLQISFKWRRINRALWLVFWGAWHKHRTPCHVLCVHCEFLHLSSPCSEFFLILYTVKQRVDISRSGFTFCFYL